MLLDPESSRSSGGGRCCCCCLAESCIVPVKNANVDDASDVSDAVFLPRFATTTVSTSVPLTLVLLERERGAGPSRAASAAVKLRDRLWEEERLAEAVDREGAREKCGGVLAEPRRAPWFKGEGAGRGLVKEMVQPTVSPAKKTPLLEKLAVTKDCRKRNGLAEEG